MSGWTQPDCSSFEQVLQPVKVRQGDLFGSSSSIDRDTMVVGAYSDDTAGANSGAAYVFKRLGGLWTQTHMLVGDLGDNSFYGEDVAVLGDFICVCARGSLTPTAFLYQWNGTDWDLHRELRQDNPQPSVDFCSSVDMNDDFIVVGAPRSNSNKGSAFVFSRQNWQQVAQLTAADGVSGDFFGVDVSISATHALVGAVNADKAYLFNSNWTQVKTLTPSDGSTGDSYGISVGLTEQYALVTATKNSGWTGAAYIYSNASAWNQTQKLSAADGLAGDLFGHSSALGADFLVVGAYQDDHPGVTSGGSAYVFAMHGGAWVEARKLVPASGSDHDLYGSSCAIFNRTVVVAAPEVGESNGTAYAYCLDEVTATPTMSPTAAPSRSPSQSPTSAPSSSPSQSPISTPSTSPSQSPTSAPSTSPSQSPTSAPSTSPSQSPTSTLSTSSSQSPTSALSTSLSQSPTLGGTLQPTGAPTISSPVVVVVSAGADVELSSGDPVVELDIPRTASVTVSSSISIVNNVTGSGSFEVSPGVAVQIGGVLQVSGVVLGAGAQAQAGTLVLDDQSSVFVSPAASGTPLRIVDSALLAGALQVNLTSRPPSGGQSIELITYSSHTGQFSRMNATADYLGSQCDSVALTPVYGPSSFSVSLSVIDICSAGSLHPGALAGIVVGAILFVVLVVGIPLGLKARSQRRRVEGQLAAIG